MNWTGSTPRGLLLAGSLVLGCGTKTADPASGSESDGQDATTEGSGSSTSASASATSVDDSGSGTGGSSSTGGVSLPCAWVEGTYGEVLGDGDTASTVSCDPETNTATIQLAFEDFSCGDTATGDRLRIELPPAMQTAGEYDLTGLVATIYMNADLSPVTGQVDSGTLIIAEVTPTTVKGWARGGLDGYDFVGGFETEYCP